MADIQDIERDLRGERDLLRAQIHAFGGNMRPGRLLDAATNQLREGTMAPVAPVLKGQTAPMALTGIGLSWLATTLLTQGPEKSAAAYDTRPTSPSPGLRRTDPEGPAMATFDTRVRAADRADACGRFGTEIYQEDPHMSTIHNAQPTLRDRAFASAASLRDKIEDGMDTLPDAAKARIRAAREAAIEAQARVEYHASRTASAARQTAHENPLLIGALAFAAGAVIAAALPRTSTENRAIGAQRDRLFDEADRVFREEVEKAKSAAQDAMEKGQEQVKKGIETAADGVSQAAEKMKSGTSRSASNGAAHN